MPALELDDGTVLTQSLAIIEWLDETRPEPPLLPREPLARARVRAFALAIAAEIHAVQNLKVLNRVKALGHAQEVANAWAHDVIAEGLAACETMLRDGAGCGPFCFGTTPGLADLCLVPQLYNARRFSVPLDPFPTLRRADESASALPAFAAAHPDRIAQEELAQ